MSEIKLSQAKYVHEAWTRSGGTATLSPEEVMRLSPIMRQGALADPRSAEDRMAKLTATIKRAGLVMTGAALLQCDVPIETVFGTLHGPMYTQDQDTLEPSARTLELAGAERSLNTDQALRLGSSLCALADTAEDFISCYRVLLWENQRPGGMWRNFRAHPHRLFARRRLGELLDYPEPAHLVLATASYQSAGEQEEFMGLNVIVDLFPSDQLVMEARVGVRPFDDGSVSASVSTACHRLVSGQGSTIVLQHSPKTADAEVGLMAQTLFLQMRPPAED